MMNQILPTGIVQGIISVGGYTDDPDFLAVDQSGSYNRSNYFNAGFDCFITQFSSDQYQLWNTLFGGETGALGASSNIPENIHSLNMINGSLYATGYTEKHSVPATSYFPLDNQESGAWFNDLFNGNGYTTTTGDGFITQFCNELSTGIPSASKPTQDGLQVITPRPGTIALIGLSDGPHELRIYDAEGRLVLMKQVISASGRTNEIDMQRCVSALYIVRVDAIQTAKFIPLQ